MPDPVYAVIDVGSNTVHMLVAAVAGGSLQSLDDCSEPIGLGIDLERDGEISPARMAAAAATVREYGERAQEMGARAIWLLATQAVRAASNRAVVVRALEEASGLAVQVIEPDYEAELAARGSGLIHHWRHPHLMVDIGGASTQLARMEDGRLTVTRSLPLGSGRLATHFSHDPPTQEEVNSLSEGIDRALGLALEPFREAGLPLPAVVTGGAAKRVAKVAMGEPPVRVTRAQIEIALDRLLGSEALSIACDYDLQEDRVPLTRVGALVLHALFRLGALAECLISPYGIREGAVLAMAERDEGDESQ